MRQLFIVMAFFFGLSKSLIAQSTELSGALEAGFKSGNAISLSQYFSDQIDLTIDDQTNTSGKKESKAALGDFFKKCGNKNFEWKHLGNSKGKEKFLVGVLYAKTGNYRVQVKASPNNGGNLLIDTLEISKE
jgi:hypothetical protein